MEAIKSCLASFIILAIIFSLQYLDYDFFVNFTESIICLLFLTFVYILRVVMQLKKVKLSAITELKSGEFKSKDSLTLNELRLIRNRSFGSCKAFTKESLKQQNRKIMYESLHENAKALKPVVVKQASNKPVDILMEDRLVDPLERSTNVKLNDNKGHIHEASLSSIVFKKKHNS